MRDAEQGERNRIIASGGRADRYERSIKQKKYEIPPDRQMKRMLSGGIIVRNKITKQISRQDDTKSMLLYAFL